MTHKDEWRSLSGISGAPSVTTTGAPTTPWWSADSWVYPLLELRLFHLLTSDKEMDQSFLIMSVAQGKRPTSLTAPTMDCLITTVPTTRMPESCVKVHLYFKCLYHNLLHSNFSLSFFPPPLPLHTHTHICSCQHFLPVPCQVSCQRNSSRNSRGYSGNLCQRNVGYSL